MPTWKTVCKLGSQLPDVEEDRWYGTPALKVAGKGFARLREDGAVVVFVDVLEREALMQSDPETFYITPHYQDYPMVLINVKRVDPAELRELLIESWRYKAPKRLLKAFDEAWEAESG